MIPIWAEQRVHNEFVETIREFFQRLISVMIQDFLKSKTYFESRPVIDFLFKDSETKKSNAYLIIMTSESSSCSTLSKYIISRSDTIAPLITIISSPLIMPGAENKLLLEWLLFASPKQEAKRNKGD